MLMATISIIMPGMNRVYMQGLGIGHFTFIETYLTMDALVAAILPTTDPVRWDPAPLADAILQAAAAKAARRAPA